MGIESRVDKRENELNGKWFGECFEEVSLLLFFETKAHNQSHFTSVSALYTPLLQCTTSLKTQYCQQREADQPILVYITFNFKGTVGRFCIFT